MCVCVHLTDYGSVFWQSWSQYLLLCRTRCTSSIIPCHLLDFIVQRKITDADALKICLDATSSVLSVPHLHHLPTFMPNTLSVATLPIYLGLGQAPNKACLHTRWLKAADIFTKHEQTEPRYRYLSVRGLGQWLIQS